MSFSQRHGLAPTSKPLQLDTMDHELHNSLWNVLYINVLRKVEPTSQSDNGFSIFRSDYTVNFLKERLHNATWYHHTLISQVEGYFHSSTWNEIYDLLEFFFEKPYVDKNYLFHLNEILEREFSAFRVINKMIVPVSNTVEIETITQALDYGLRFTGFAGINIHLNKALKFLSDKDQSDYSASIRESITAVETAAKLITKEGSLGNALNKLEHSGLEINTQLKESFNKIYAYSNDKASAIRHAVVENHQPPNFETAKFFAYKLKCVYQLFNVTFSKGWVIQITVSTMPKM